MSKLPKVSLIVPVWFNDDAGRDMTIKSIDSMEKTIYPDYDLILVDDCSPYGHVANDDFAVDDTAFDIIKRRYGGRHTVVQTPQNGGSTVAVNYGLQFTDAAFVQYQNNDVEFPDPYWLQKQMGYFDDPEVGVVGCKMRYPDGRIQHAGACWRSIGEHAIDHIGQRQQDIKPWSDVPFVTGCGMTIRREILEKNGGGFTVFQGYGWDDIDIQVKAKKWGWKVKVAHEAEFVHFGSFSYRQLPDLASRENYLANLANFAEIPIEPEETIGHFQKLLYLE